MSLAGIVAAGRRAAESLMTDTCLITRAGTGSGTLDPDTGLYPPVPSTTVHDGACMVRVPGTVSASKSRQSAGDEAVMLTAILSVPASAPLVKINDVVEFTGSEFNPRLVGQTFTVDGLIPGSHQTAQRVSITAVVD